MDRKAAKPGDDGQAVGQVRRRRDRTPDLSPDPSNDKLLDGLRIRCHSSAAVREVPSNPATHGSATRQVVSGKVFKKCKSATFQIDGATYTIGELRLIISRHLKYS
jgi:hypothetical protein